MKKSRFSDSQILSILKQAEGGAPVPELCREHGMSSATFYKWRAKFGGMDASMMARLKELEDENRRLKKMYAEERFVMPPSRIPISNATTARCVTIGWHSICSTALKKSRIMLLAGSGTTITNDPIWDSEASLLNRS